jgi:carboxylesterase type B
MAWADGLKLAWVCSQLDSGAVRGYVGTKSRSFLGIPFAAPPVGNLRWQPPQMPEVGFVASV